MLTANTSVFGLFAGTEESGGSDTSGKRVIYYTYNILEGGDGADTFRSRGGDDSIVGGGGNDRFEPLEAGILVSNALTLPVTNYPSGTTFGDSRIALDGVETTAAEPTEHPDVQVKLP